MPRQPQIIPLNYNTNSSLFSLQYKLPSSPQFQSSRFVEQLQQSQQQLQFLKQKLTQAYHKLQQEIHINIQLSDNNQHLQDKTQDLIKKLQLEITQNKKLKQIMQSVVENRKICQQELQYTHKRYKRMLEEKEQEYMGKLEDMDRVVKRLRKENQILEGRLQDIIMQKDVFSVSTNVSNADKQRKLQHKIQILENQIKKITTQKVTEVSRLKHEIQCYQRTSLSPIRSTQAEQKPVTTRPPKIEYFDISSSYSQIQNDENQNPNTTTTTIFQSKPPQKPQNQPNPSHPSHNTSTVLTTTNSRSQLNQQPQIASKWSRQRPSQLTDDQRLTRAQMERKKLENQLMKIQRLKRQGPDDRQAMDELERKIYEVDSEISGLKRKIRQKY